MASGDGVPIKGQSLMAALGGHLAREVCMPGASFSTLSHSLLIVSVVWPQVLNQSSLSSIGKICSVKRVKGVKAKKGVFGSFLPKTHTTLSIFCPLHITHTRIKSLICVIVSVVSRNKQLHGHNQSVPAALEVSTH